MIRIMSPGLRGTMKRQGIKLTEISHYTVICVVKKELKINTLIMHFSYTSEGVALCIIYRVFIL